MCQYKSTEHQQINKQQKRFKMKALLNKCMTGHHAQTKMHICKQYNKQCILII